MFNKLKLLSFLTLPIFVGSCAAVGGREVFVSQRPVAQASEDLAAEFYEGSWELPAMQQKIQKSLKEGGGDCRLYELAGQLAQLTGADDTALKYFLQAAADDTCQDGTLNIMRCFDLTLTVSELQILEQGLENISAHSGDNRRRLVASNMLADLYERFGKERQVEKLPAWPYIESWRLLGSFENDHGKGFSSAYLPEQEEREELSYPGMLRQISWREVQTSGNYLSLDNLLSPNNQAVAYAKVYLEAPTAGNYTLLLHTTASTAVWLNDVKIYNEEFLANNVLENVEIPVTLAAGWNKLLIKSAVLNQKWEVGALFLDEAGKPVALNSSSADKPYQPVSFQPGAALSRLSEKQKPLLVRLQLAVMQGQNRYARELLEENSDDHPDNPLYSYLAANIYLAENYQGQALDILQKALNGSEKPAPLLFTARAKYYGEKEIWDRAMGDLQTALNAYPFCRTCRMEMAALMKARGWEVEALDYLEETDGLWPDMPWNQRLMVTVYENLGYGQKALDLLTAALKKEPGRPWLLKTARDFYSKSRNYSKALQYNKPLLGDRVLSRYEALKQAQLLHSNGQTVGAEELLNKLITQDPDWHKPFNLLGRINMEKDLPEKAIAYYREALEREPQNYQLAEHIDFLQNNTADLVAEYLPSDEEIEALIATSGELEILSGANVVYLLDHEITIVNQDGSAKRVVTQVTKALNTEGRDAIIQENLPRRGSVKILQAYARQPDGSRQDAASIRGGEIRFRGIEVGSATVVQYVHYAPQQVFLPQHFASDWYFQGVERQHEKSIWILAIPNEKQLLTKKSPQVDLQEKASDKYRIYQFSGNHIPPMVKENNMPHPADYLVRASVTTVPSWDEYVAWDKSLLTTALQKDSKIEVLGSRLTAGAADKMGEFWKLFAYVSSEIRYQNDYENTIAGVRPHAPGLVIERGYGDCKDKALLLIALAATRGIRVDYVSVRTSNYGEVNREQPDQQFNHAITYVPVQEGIAAGFFIDPTVDALDFGNLRVDDQGTLALVMNVQTGEYRFERIPYASYESELREFEIEVVVNSPEEALAQAKVTLHGQFGSAFRQLIRNDMLARQLFMNFSANLFKGATLLSAQVENGDNYSAPVSLTLMMDVSKALVPQGDVYRLELPGSMISADDVKLEERRYPLWFISKAGSVVNFKLKLPEKGEFEYLPAAYKYGAPEMLLVERRVNRTGQQVQIETRSVRDTTLVTPEQYGEYRQILIKSGQHNTEALLLKLP